MNRLFEQLARFNRREQAMLLLGGFAIFLWLLWMVLLSPLQNRLERQLQSNTSAMQTQSDVQLYAARIQSYRAREGRSTGDSASISRIVDTSLRANNLSMTSLQPGTAGEVRVRLDQAPYDRLMQWLYDLEYRHDLSIQDLSIAGGNEPGRVNVTVRLRQ